MDEVEVAVEPVLVVVVFALVVVLLVDDEGFDGGRGLVRRLGVLEVVAVIRSLRKSTRGPIAIPLTLHKCFLSNFDPMIYLAILRKCVVYQLNLYAIFSSLFPFWYPRLMLPCLMRLVALRIT